MTEIDRLKKQNKKLFERLSQAVYNQRYYMRQRGTHIKGYAKMQRERRNDQATFEKGRKTFLKSLGYHKIINSNRKKGRRYLMKLTRNEIKSLHHVLESGILMQFRKTNQPKNYHLFYASPAQASRLRKLSNYVLNPGARINMLRRDPLK